jgi:hypothetical protein
VGLVELQPRAVLELVAERAFPLRAGDRVEASILEALEPLVAHRGLDAIELLHRLRVHGLQPIFLRLLAHVTAPPAASRG